MTTTLQQQRARTKARKALKLGMLVKKPCEICGDLKVEMHHTDYSRPLDIRWLCRKHHAQADIEVSNSRKHKFIQSQYQSLSNFKKNKLPKIEATKYYSLVEIHKKRLIPWAYHMKTLRKIMMWDTNVTHELNPKITGSGTQTRYSILGSKLIDYLKKYGVMWNFRRKAKKIVF